MVQGLGRLGTTISKTHIFHILIAHTAQEQVGFRYMIADTLTPRDVFHSLAAQRSYSFSQSIKTTLLYGFLQMQDLLSHVLVNYGNISVISFVSIQVGLWKSHSKHKADEGCFVAHQKQAMQKKMANTNLKSLQNIIHEIELLRSSQDRQVEEAMRCNQRLEQELWSSKETVAALEDCNRALKREQVAMRRKVEEARQALLSGLGKVKELEAKANHVSALQRHILQLESELLYYR